jgi:sulfate adenylyltransferase
MSSTPSVVLKPRRADAPLIAESTDWPSWTLTPRQLCDLELLMNGGFAPLTSFMGRQDYESVCARLRLTDGSLWPLPVVLDVPDDLAATLQGGATLALRDTEGTLLAALRVTDVWMPDRIAEAHAVYGTVSASHPGVDVLLNHTARWYVGGRLEEVQRPIHHDFQSLRLTPEEVRADFAARGWTRVVAFESRNPMTRAHDAIVRRVMRDVEAALLLHPVFGVRKPGDLDPYATARSFHTTIAHLPPGRARLALLPHAARLAGPREALLGALIRRNFGCTHFIVGRDHAGPGVGQDGGWFYDEYAACDLLETHRAELGIAVVPVPKYVYVKDLDRHIPRSEVVPGSTVLQMSHTDLRHRLEAGLDIPHWFMAGDIADQVRAAHPPRSERGLTIFFTGLSGAGKSTVASLLAVRLNETGERLVTLLDGDVVRRHLSSELGFSKEDRDLNIRRIGFVASEVARHRGIAICAPIAPYDQVRKEVRQMADAAGGFILVHLTTPLEVCEQRDPKGLYAKARAGLVSHFTGVSDPYEEPADAELKINTATTSAEAAVALILTFLRARGYLR